MNVLIILPHPDQGSFNHALADNCKQRLIENRHRVIFHDLHREKFDPFITTEEIPEEGSFSNPIKKHCDDLVNNNTIIIVHPNWRGKPSAILKS